jgi:ferritin-like metal-binding protein YciE
LQRVVDAIGSIFRADQKAVAKAQRSQEASELKQKQDQVYRDTANQLVALTELIEQDPEKAKSELQTTIKKLLKT